MIGRRYVVTGRVQGVGFRWFTEREAHAEGLTGWVANREDGSVEAVVEGPADAVARFEARLRMGPSHALVRAVQVIEEPPGGHWAGFRIR